VVMAGMNIDTSGCSGIDMRMCRIERHQHHANVQ
jgi:hypothetical protein